MTVCCIVEVKESFGSSSPSKVKNCETEMEIMCKATNRSDVMRGTTGCPTGGGPGKEASAL